MPPGRPTKLNQETQEAIVDALKKGVPKRFAAQLAGIVPSTLYDWIAKGEEGDPQFADFSDAVARAEAEAVRHYVQSIHNAATSAPHLGLTLLSRIHPDEFGDSKGVIAKLVDDVSVLKDAAARNAPPASGKPEEEGDDE